MSRVEGRGRAKKENEKFQGRVTTGDLQLTTYLHCLLRDTPSTQERPYGTVPRQGAQRARRRTQLQRWPLVAGPCRCSVAGIDTSPRRVQIDVASPRAAPSETVVPIPILNHKLKQRGTVVLPRVENRIPHRYGCFEEWQCSQWTP